jgi:hypothetical protein
MDMSEIGLGLGSSNTEEMETYIQGFHAYTCGSVLNNGDSGAQIAMRSPGELADEERLSMSTLGLSLPSAEETTPRPSTPSHFDKTSASAEGNLSWMRHDRGESTLLSGEQIRAKLRDTCGQYSQTH